MSNKPVIFLCGPDMCGKTEIAKALSKKLEIPYYKASAERGAFVSGQSRFINDIRWACPARLDLLKQMDSGIVYDRGYPCEWVYSKFFGRETDLNAIQFLDNEYADMGAVIIIPYRTSYVGIQDDLDPTIDSHKLEELTRLYDEFAKMTQCRVLKLNVDDEDLDRELQDIIQFMNEKEEK